MARATVAEQQSELESDSTTQSVIDVTEATLYWIDAWSRRPSLIKVNLANYSVAAIPLPPQWKPPAAADHDIYLVFVRSTVFF